MGLFGLTMFTTTSRTKEIGVRKVMGASIISIVKMLNLELVKLILLSSLIAIPIAWYLIRKWLDSYAFRIEISWWMFAIPIIVVMIIAIFTTSFLTIRAATANPTKSLRYE
jgi:putative ABC transport system permease protein